jgi:asparagine synthase (glutamine-hydrolysing)
MCGICGVVQVDGPPRPVLSESGLGVMTDVMTHRGPDDRGLYLDGGIALGVRRLSIVDVEGGHQPLANESGEVWAIQNGELYNHEELRRRLEREGHSFRSRCDTEVLPHLYERFGPMFPAQLRGMFGLAIWDAQRRRAVLARDRLGIKPLYYAQRGDVLVFASELKSLLASGLIEGELDYEAIDAYLTFGFVPGPMTPLARVSKLMPGQILVVEDGRVRTERFWSYPIPQVAERRSEGEYRELLLDKLSESVRLRLMSDVPLGAMLSGGIDSSLIVALMATHMSEPVKTFSVGFVEAGAENELADARQVAEFFSTDHHELELSFTKDTVDLEELVWHLDEPLADLSALGFLALSELASRHVTVALSGQGADELFGGYAKHRAAALVGSWRRLPTPITALGDRLAPYAPSRFQRPAQTLAAPDAVERLLAMSGKVDAEQRALLVRGPLAELEGDAARRAVQARLDGVADDPLTATLYIDGQLALVDDMLHYFDRASMAHSLEVRVPFLDHEFVELCALMPGDLKVRRLTTKYILKQTARGLIPDRTINKKKVGFFRGSVGGWFQAQADRSIREYLLRPDARYAEILDPGAVRGLIERQAAEVETPERHLLLAILMLEIWLSSYLPRACSGTQGGPRERVTIQQ